MADIKSLGIRMIKAMTSNDAEGMNAVLHEQVIWRYPESARKKGVEPVRRGRDNLTSLVAGAFKSMYRRLTPRFDLVVAEGDHVVVMCQLQGETFDGQPYDNCYVFIMRFAGDRIVEGWEHLDTQKTADLKI